MLSKFWAAAPSVVANWTSQQGKISQWYYIVSYPALLETPRTKRTIFQISQASGRSWKILGLQRCFVKFGCGTDNIFFYKSVKFPINIFHSSILRVIHILKPYPCTQMSRLIFFTHLSGQHFIFLRNFFLAESIIFWGVQAFRYAYVVCTLF